jgi:hypothetical protein
MHKRKDIKSCLSNISSSLSLLFALAGNDLDPLRLDRVGIIELELDILDDERPDFVAEAVCVEVSLKSRISTASNPVVCSSQISYLECHPSLHLFSKHG